MHSRTSTFFALAASAIAATALFGETQTWNPAEGSAVWDLAAPNWDAGSIWTDWNAARFPAGTAGAVSVEGDVPVTDITFEGDTVLGGPGRLVLLANPEATAASAYTVQTWNVCPDVQAEVSATVASEKTNGATLVKDGTGTMTLSGLVQVPRIHVRNGLLAFVNSSNEVGRIRASASESPAVSRSTRTGRTWTSGWRWSFRWTRLGRTTSKPQGPSPIRASRVARRAGRSRRRIRAPTVRAP